MKTVDGHRIPDDAVVIDSDPKGKYFIWAVPMSEYRGQPSVILTGIESAGVILTREMIEKLAGMLP